MIILRYVAAILLLSFASSGFCARPMITDDARVVDPKSCQVESWIKFNRNSTEYWALPGCNVTENLELTYGGAITKEHGEAHTTDVILQAKTIFRPLKTNDYGTGLVIGHAQHPATDNDSSMIGDVYAYVPVSFSIADDKYVLHTNLGVIHDKNVRANKLTWGLGSETRLASNLQLIAEVYGDNQSRAFHQLGLRYWIVPDRIQIDTTYGNRFANNGEEQWLSVGLRLLSLPFLP